MNIAESSDLKAYVGRAKEVNLRPFKILLQRKKDGGGSLHTGGSGVWNIEGNVGKRV